MANCLEFHPSDLKALISLVLIWIPFSLQASADEIKQAWKKQVLLYHPDRHPHREEANSRFLDIQHAYEILKDSVLRAEYDKELLHRLYLEVSAFSYPGIPNSRSSCLTQWSHSSRHLSKSIISSCPYLQEYLRRFADLILTASGLGLPLEHDTTTCTAGRLFYLEDAIKEGLVKV